MEVRRTARFSTWLLGLPDSRARARMHLGSIGLQAAIPATWRPSEKVSEMRVRYGPGYRVYFAQRGATIVVLLCGGDKGTQAKDIRETITLASQMDD